MELDLSGTQDQIVVSIDGKKFPLRRAKIKEVRALNDQLKKAETGAVSYFDVVGDFLSKLGLPIDQFEELELWQCEKIINEIASVGSKKK